MIEYTISDVAPLHCVPRISIEDATRKMTDTEDLLNKSKWLSRWHTEKASFSAVFAAIRTFASGYWNFNFSHFLHKKRPSMLPDGSKNFKAHSI
jgi:hypothetical protein